MEPLWHTFLLVMTLVTAAAVVVVGVAPLLFESNSEGVARARPWVAGLVLVTLGLYLLEWRVLH